jgi:hypothetical protein
MDCIIRKWRLSDAGELAFNLSNKKVLNNLRDGLPYPYTVKDAEEYITNMLNSDNDNTFAFAIVSNDKVIGSIGVFRCENIHNRTAELGYYIGEPYWGKDSFRNTRQHYTMNTLAAICILLAVVYFFSKKKVIEISFTDKRICVPQKSMTNNEYHMLYQSILSAKKNN